MKLALQLTGVDMLSGLLDRVKKNVLNLGAAGEQVSRDFDRMNAHITKGLQGVAVAAYGVHQIAKGIVPAGNLQEEMINVEMSLMKSGKEASILNRELDEVRKTAIELQKITPFSAQEMVKAEKEFLNSGVEFSSVVGNGATKSSAAFATITGASIEQAQAAMLNIGVPYHLKGAEYVEVADVLQRHVMSGRLKVGGFEEALKNSAGVTKGFKLPWHDLVTGLAVIGESGFVGSEAGTYYKDFLERLTGSSRMTRKAMAAANHQLRAEGKGELKFWDNKGELLPMHNIIKQLRATLGSMDTHHKMFYLEKMFGQQGGQGGLALMKDGPGSWEAVLQRAAEAASLSDKMAKRLEGFNANLTALQGTSKTTAAVVFDPMLQPLTKLVQLLNDATAGLGTFSEEHKTLTKGANYLAGGAVAGAGIFGAYHLVRGAISGGKVLKGIGGFKGLLGGAAGIGLGVAEGKALQVAAGVQPVFVVNMPGNLGGASSIIGGAAEAAAGAAGATALVKTFASTFAAATPWLATAVVSALGGYIIGGGINRGLAKFSGWLSDGKYGGDGWLGERIYDEQQKPENKVGAGWLADMGFGEKQKNEINMNISVDAQNRVTSWTDDTNTTTNITTNRGSFTDPDSYK